MPQAFRIIDVNFSRGEREGWGLWNWHQVTGNDYANISGTAAQKNEEGLGEEKAVSQCVVLIHICRAGFSASWAKKQAWSWNEPVLNIKQKRLHFFFKCWSKERIQRKRRRLSRYGSRKSLGTNLWKKEQEKGGRVGGEKRKGGGEKPYVQN